MIDMRFSADPIYAKFYSVNYIDDIGFSAGPA